MTEQQKEQRRIAYYRSHGMCAVCGKPLSLGQPQYAHKIANTDTNRKKYGSFVIDHTLNGDYTCSLECNQVMNIGNNPGKCLLLIADIVTYELEHFNRED